MVTSLNKLKSAIHFGVYISSNCTFELFRTDFEIESGNVELICLNEGYI